ncbi:hypothetical protein DFH08DRAFT_939033 [Mycena albidolilacea]|uniref:Uncharacterized protein n=1 Tax=Mycena albidolilacea TaxID=1033008 RepID=A0AAD6ZT67_9AGAR|nr:hypothetical protein DFH08DRAFT_939033 [Mycena albidolilacea]
MTSKCVSSKFKPRSTGLSTDSIPIDRSVTGLHRPYCIRYGPNTASTGRFVCYGRGPIRPYAAIRFDTVSDGGQLDLRHLLQQRAQILGCSRSYADAAELDVARLVPTSDLQITPNQSLATLVADFGAPSTSIPSNCNIGFERLKMAVLRRIRCYGTDKYGVQFRSTVGVLFLPAVRLWTQATQRGSGSDADSEVSYFARRRARSKIQNQRRGEKKKRNKEEQKS